MLTAILQGLKAQIGVEQPMDLLNQQLRAATRKLRPAGVGALRLTCADESERESIDSFQRHYVQPLLPTMKFWSKSPFRLANLGSQYEPGALRIAEDHFATPETLQDFKVMMVKISSHVSVESHGSGYVYGKMERYESESVFCGALHALMAGSDLPFARRLSETFRSGGRDRLAELMDGSRVRPETRALLAALVNARLQAQKVVDEIPGFTPRSPTIYLVAAGVTLNRQDRDTELLCGIHAADFRENSAQIRYLGLGDSPADVKIHHQYGVLTVSDSQFSQARSA